VREADELDNWHPPSLAGLGELLRDAPFPWWIAGGWAIDLFVARPTRAHHDLDVELLRRRDRPRRRQRRSGQRHPRGGRDRRRQEFVAEARDVAKGCTSPFPAGSLTLVPAAEQPKLKKAGDGVTVLATTVQSSGNAVFQIYMREGKYFISYISIVAAPQVTTLDTADLNAVTKAAAKHLATVAKEYRKKT
jgi:Aminoglycoside-2''-adenylyltransferase